MKTLLALIIIAISLASHAADRIVFLNSAVTGRALTKNNVTTTNGGTIITAAPTKVSVNVATTLLPMLARAEHFEGNYPTTTFPTGSRLILAYDLDDISLN